MRDKQSLIKKNKEITAKINEKWNLAEKNITNEKKYLDPETTDKLQYIKERKQEIADSRAKDIQREQEKLNNQYGAIRPLIEAFVPASVWNFGSWGAFMDMSLPCVCLGVSINEKSKNPFAPSNIEIAFAISDSTRYFKFNCANEQRQYLQLIKSAPKWNIDRKAVENWDEITKKRTANREKRVLITGNILQAYDKEDYAKGGKLVSFTRKNGDVEKGILLRRDIGDKLQEQNTRQTASVNVPIEKAKDFIMKLPSGNRVQCSGRFYIVRKYGGDFQIITNGGSKQEFASLITNGRLIDLADNENGFVLARSQWNATFSDNDMSAVIDELATMSINVRVEGADAENLQRQLEKDSTGNNWKKISWNENNIPKNNTPKSSPKSQKNNSDNDRLRLLELEMEMEIAIMEMELEMGVYKSVAGL